MIITTDKIDLKTTKHKIKNNGRYLSYSEWIDSMLSSEEEIVTFNQCLADSKFKAFFWEVKPVNLQLMNQEFEFVLVDSISLQRIVSDNSNFKKYFTKNDMTVNFPNLRGDAELIVPVPIFTETKYVHIAEFVRTAKPKQLVDFWKNVVIAYSNKINDQLKWLSTSGLGVHWLHVRIDSKPKYYQHLAYKI